MVPSRWAIAPTPQSLAAQPLPSTHARTHARTHVRTHVRTQVVGLAKNDMLTHTLIDYLMGESDGVPKDPNYIFRLYMALGNFPQATRP